MISPLGKLRATGLIEPLKFAVVGGANSFVDVAIFWALTSGAGADPLHANVLSFIVGAANSYLLNSRFTFSRRTGSRDGSPARAAAFALVTIVTLAASTLALALALHVLPPLPAKLVSIGATFVVGYLLNSQLVFAAGKLGAAGTPAWLPETMPRPALVPSTIAMLCLAIAALVARVPVPPLLDYPNHLVRLWLIAGGADRPSLQDKYVVDWSAALTNVGIDYTAALLGSAVPASALGSLLLWLAIVLGPLGAVALNRSLFSCWCPLQIAALLLAFPATMIGGFLNFHVGIGLALFAAAGSIRLSERTIAAQAAGHLVIGAVLLSVHVFSLAFYLALVCGLALGPRLGALAVASVARRAASAAAIAIVSAAAPLAVVSLLAPSLPGAHTDAIGNAPLWNFTLASKFYTLLTPFASYHLPVDLLFAVAFLIPIAFAFVTARPRRHDGVLLAAAGLIALGMVAPTAVAGTWWIDNRFPVMGLLALIAALHLDRPAPDRAAVTLAIALALVAALRIAWIAGIWESRAADVGSVRRAVQSVPPGAAILPLDNVGDGPMRPCIPLGRYFHNGHPTHWSYPTLAIMWRGAFVPNIFWAAGKQPLRVRPPWDGISYPEDGLHATAMLADGSRAPHHFRDWRRRFDFVLELNADCGSGLDPASRPELSLERDEGFARLYRVRRTP